MKLNKLRYGKAAARTDVTKCKMQASFNCSTDMLTWYLIFFTLLKY